MSLRLGAVVLACGLAACTYETRTVLVPAAPAEDACVAYGFIPGTVEYRMCADREADARRRGRVAVDYGEARMVADAQFACTSYGLMRGTDRYERCVQRELLYRRPA